MYDSLVYYAQAFDSTYHLTENPNPEMNTDTPGQNFYYFFKIIWLVQIAYN